MLSSLRRFWLRLLGYGETDCPRCGKRFSCHDYKGIAWYTPNNGRLTCCRGDTYEFK